MSITTQFLLHTRRAAAIRQIMIAKLNLSLKSMPSQPLYDDRTRILVVTAAFKHRCRCIWTSTPATASNFASRCWRSTSRRQKIEHRKTFKTPQRNDCLKAVYTFLPNKKPNGQSSYDIKLSPLHNFSTFQNPQLYYIPTFSKLRDGRTR
jgi:hypothetical protein